MHAVPATPSERATALLPLCYWFVRVQLEENQHRRAVKRSSRPTKIYIYMERGWPFGFTLLLTVGYFKKSLSIVP